MKEPTDNITFLFTDIEGSTKLSQEFPETLQSALDRHHSIMHNAIESNKGFVFEIIGDAFCCAFKNAEDAVKAAIDAQVNLGEEKWDDVVIKIRIGIHSGNAVWTGKRYMGYITLARTARVMSAAYGEQILISNDAYELSVPKLRYGNESDMNKGGESIISFRDLGERRLKDLIQPVRLYQVIAERLVKNFPPIKALDARPNNLPVQLTSFVGREKELSQIKNILGQSRLLTILGSGGGGKTRLALQAGADMIDEFANGVYIAELAPVSDPAFVKKSILNALDIKEEGKRSPEETLKVFLKDKELLLIIDNCEHLINECANISELLLSNCPKVKIIATSREILNCTGEQTYKLSSLSMPEITKDSLKNFTIESLSQFESVRLFIERTLLVNLNFNFTDENAPALAKICNKLDGIPLAIELAAARTKVLSVEKICERLDDRFNLLSAGKRTVLPRQQTLRALIDWSYDLLSDQEKILWSRLSIFHGGWTIESAEEICSDNKLTKAEILNLLSQISEKSIILYDEENERYRILETIKQYGEEKLKESDETEKVLTKYLQYFMEFSESVEPKLNGTEAEIWLERLETEHSNFQSAISLAVSTGNYETAARLAGALGSFWEIRGHYSAGRPLLESVLKNRSGISKSVLAKTLNCNGILTRSQGEYEKAQNLYDESLALQREIGDERGIASSLNGLGNIELHKGAYEQAQRFFEESLSLSRKLGDKRGIAFSLTNLANAAFDRGNYELALKFNEESLALRMEIGDKRQIASSMHNLGGVAYYLGNYEKAQEYYEGSLGLNRDINDKRSIALSLTGLGNVASDRGNYENAKLFLEESLSLSRELGDKSGIAVTIIGLGDLAYYQEKFEEAKKFCEESLTLFREIGDKRGIAYSFHNAGLISIEQKNFEKAKEFHGESLRIFNEIGDKRGVAISLIGFSMIFYVDGNFSDSVKMLAAADTIIESLHAVLERNEQKLQDHILNIQHKKLSDEEFGKYFEEGKMMTLADAYQLIINSNWRM